MSPQASAGSGRGRAFRVGLAAALGLVVGIAPLAAAVLAATPDFPPTTELPVDVSPAAAILRTVVQVAPLVAAILALLFRARLRAADGRRIGSVLAIRLLPLVGLATLALGVAAIPVCARLDNYRFLPGIECMVPGVVLAEVGVTSFIVHAPLARVFASRPALAAWLAFGLSIPVIFAYSALSSALTSVGA
jgi:hypothetical protein